MAGYRLPGSSCVTTYPALDEGTSSLTCSPSPGPLCASRGSPVRKASHGSAGARSAQRQIIRKARADALDLLGKRLDDLNQWDVEMKALTLDPRTRAIDEWMKPLSPRGEATRKLFLGWFGTVSAAARNRIRKRIVRAMRKLKMLHDSDFVNEVKEKEYAYVNPKIIDHGKYEGTVHLGRKFWSTDAKTRAGTLIHELSHFVTVGDTDDVGVERKDRAATDFPGKEVDPKDDLSYATYGGTRGTRLAVANPSLALKNADSFEFFVEGDEPSVVQDEHGTMDTEGFGDFPGLGNNRL
jgi:hypothetical protein